MGDVSTSRPIEDFLINPTIAADSSMDLLARHSVMREPPVNLRLDRFLLNDGKNDQSLGRPLSTIHELMNDSHFLSAYDSEEEAVSPSDSADTLSNRSFTLGPSRPVSRPPALIPDRLAKTCGQIEQRCDRAHAVVFKPAGKPKMVSMPKVVEIASPGRFKRLSSQSTPDFRQSPSPRPRTRREIREELFPYHFVRYDDGRATPTSPVPAPVPTRHVSPTLDQTPRRPSVPLLRAAASFDPFPNLSELASSSRFHDGLDERPFQGHPAIPETKSPLPTSPSIPKRGLHKLAPSLWLDHVSGSLRRSASSSSPSRSPASASPRPSLSIDRSPPRTPMVPIPPRQSSMRQKLVPRGANERAPTLILPPCPEEIDEMIVLSAKGSMDLSRPVSREQWWIRPSSRPTVSNKIVGEDPFRTRTRTRMLL